MANKDSTGKELEETKNQLKRALADYSNLQKRVEEQKKALVKFANAALLIKMLDVLDTLEVASSSIKDQGLELTLKKLREILLSEGVREVDSEGKEFDPSLHEAVEAVKGDEDDMVVEVVNKGYTLEDKVLRPAKVKVSKKDQEIPS
ncbi:MAG: nucleotide exchange factor GrpE [Candidatus Woykebacteria bacterium]